MKTALSDRLREAAEWLADDLPEGVVAPQFLEGDVRLDGLDAYCVERLREAADEIDRLATSLAEIGRMRVFPDDKINRTTLAVAISMARRAGNPTPTSSEAPGGEG